MIKLSRFSTEQINNVIDEALDFSAGKQAKAREDILVSNLFFEDSTRTKTSFEVAEAKLGLKVIDFDAAKSSVNKGESLYDTVKTVEAIGIDLVVIRHGRSRYYDELENLELSIINGGDGAGDHPSQSILDIMTIKQEFGEIKGLKIAIIGDVKHSRVAKSNAQILRRMGADIYFSGPEDCFDEQIISYGSYHPIDELIGKVDVVMLLRIQHERHTQNTKIDTADHYLQTYGLTKERERKMKGKAIIMHPAPVNRGVEIDSDLVECERSRIFKQMKNGVFARMAILKNELESKGFKFYEMKK